MTIRSGVPGKLGRVRLKDEQLENMRRSRFTMDGWRCVDCGRAVGRLSGHLSHEVSRGAGGSDTIENTRTRCGECHLVHQHNPKSVPAK